jgi:hypothetical protein
VREVARCRVVCERDNPAFGTGSSIASMLSADVRGITHSSGYRSFTRRTWLGSEPRDGCHASPSSSARPAPSCCRPRSPPAATGGSEVASWNDQNSPSKSRSPLQSTHITRIASSPRWPRPSNGMPMKSYSSSCQSIPTPSVKRPPGSYCSVATSLARCIVWCSGTSTIEVLSPIRSIEPRDERCVDPRTGRLPPGGR